MILELATFLAKRFNIPLHEVQKALEDFDNWDGDKNDEDQAELSMWVLERKDATQEILKRDRNKILDNSHNITFQLLIYICIVLNRKYNLYLYEKYRENFSRLVQRKISDPRDIKGRTQLIIGQMKYDKLDESDVVGSLKNGEYYKKLLKDTGDEDKDLEHLVKTTLAKSIEHELGANKQPERA